MRYLIFIFLSFFSLFLGIFCASGRYEYFVEKFRRDGECLNRIEDSGVAGTLRLLDAGKKESSVVLSEKQVMVSAVNTYLGDNRDDKILGEGFSIDIHRESKTFLNGFDYSFIIWGIPSIPGHHVSIYISADGQTSKVLPGA